MKTLPKFLMLIALLASTSVLAQTQEVKDEDLYELSLEELLNIPISSASKKDETLFDAPLSSYTITRAEIQKAGSNSIMEALRLAPGVIVREQTNGVYDIHIRGFDNVLRHGEDFNKSNLGTLVMIDNRPVFNHNLGGTFWEGLPIDLNDVERIEIVRGPSSPLFGPNAVIGVINIITTRASAPTVVNAFVQAGTPNTIIANGTFGKKISDKFNFAISGNYQDRDRFDTKYYNEITEDYEELGKSDSRPNPERALNKYGANAFLNYKPTSKLEFDLSFGLQDSEIQKSFIGGTTPFTTGTTESQYANLAAKVYGLSIRTSYLNGTDNLNVNTAPNRYDFKITDLTAEYEIKAGDKFSIVPGISYLGSKYNDAAYVSDGLVLYGGEEVSINTTSGFIRTDIKPIKNLRVIAAVRADKFSAPDDVYLAYEFATTYKLNEKNLIRAAVTRSHSGSFIGSTYLNFTAPVMPGINFERKGNENLKLFRINMIELGYRVQFSNKVQLDIDVFRQKAENFTSLQTTGMFSQQFRNIPTTAEQLGATLSLNIVPNENFQVKPFVTFQKTEIDSLPSSYLEPSLDPTLTYTSKEHENTPSFFGGVYVNYKVGKFNFNVNSYFFSSHRQYDASDLDDNSEAGDISGKAIVNLKVNYAVLKQLNLFFNGRNMFNNSSREYYGTDRIGALYSVGASFSLN